MATGSAGRNCSAWGEHLGRDQGRNTGEVREEAAGLREGLGGSVRSKGGKERGHGVRKCSRENANAGGLGTGRAPRLSLELAVGFIIPVLKSLGRQQYNETTVSVLFFCFVLFFDPEFSLIPVIASRLLLRVYLSPPDPV